MRHVEADAVAIHFRVPTCLAGHRSTLACSVHGVVGGEDYWARIQVKRGDNVVHEKEWPLYDAVFNATIPPLSLHPHTVRISIMDRPDGSFPEDLLSTMIRAIEVVSDVDGAMQAERDAGIDVEHARHVQSISRPPDIIRGTPLVTYGKRTISICALANMGDFKSSTQVLDQTDLHMRLISSLEKTITQNELQRYDIRLYIGMQMSNADMDSVGIGHLLKGPEWLDIRLHAYASSSGPSRFNLLMRLAFEEHSDYLVRVDDDAEFLTFGWISLGVRTLEGHAVGGHTIPNVGVVWPTGEAYAHQAKLTHEMTHRTHLLIFDWYVPADVPSSWSVGDWILLVYEPGKLSTCLREWKVGFSTKYAVETGEQSSVDSVVLRGRIQVRDWIWSQLIRSTGLGRWRRETGYDGTSLVFGHVHVAKTAGTTLNGNLSLNFERVCGHKGYSYDANKVNERFKRSSGNISEQIDTIARTHPGYSRARVPHDIMEEIGFEDCDWISVEDSWTFWKQLHVSSQHVELHVPCREPVDHLMSQCNFDEAGWEPRTFSCEGDVEMETRKCLLDVERRFSNQLRSLAKTELKCFDWRFGINGEYSELLAQRGLQRKRMAAQYEARPTNSPRRRQTECL